MKKIFNEMKRMQELAGVISESSNTLREVASQGEIDTGIDNIKNKIKKLSRPIDARNETFQANEAMTAEVQKDITAFIEAFVKNEKSNEYPMFAAQKNDPNALAEAKRNFIFNEIDNRISNFFFNSGSGSFVRMYSDPYKIQVVMEMKKVADALKIPRLSKGLQSAIDAYKRGYKPEESAIDKIRAQAGIQPKAVTSESNKSFMKELRKMVEDALNEDGSWRVITNKEGEPIGKDYEYDSSDPEYYERDDMYGGGEGRQSNRGAFTAQKSDTINYLRDELKRNDIYSKIGMGSRGRYVFIPYGYQGISVIFPFKGGQMKMQIGGKTYDNVDQVLQYVLGPDFSKENFKSQSEHEGSLKTASKEKRQQAKINKAAEVERAAKQAERDKIMNIPAIKDAISKFGLGSQRNYKVIFGNVPAKKMYDSIGGIIDTLTTDELKQVRKIEVDVPKFYESKSPNGNQKITLSELKRLVMEAMNENPLGGQQSPNVAPKLNPADETKALNNAFLTANKIANDPNVLKQIQALPEDKVKMLQNLFIKYKIDPKADIDKVALTKAEDKIGDKIVSEMMSEMEDDAVMPPKQKLANVLNALGSGNIAAWGGLPLAIGIGATVGSVALGLAASWGATAVLMGIAKALDKTGKL
jgi:hypothetical protein